MINYKYDLLWFSNREVYVLIVLLATRWLLIEKNVQKKTPQSLERGVFIGGERGT